MGFQYDRSVGGFATRSEKNWAEPRTGSDVSVCHASCCCRRRAIRRRGSLTTLDAHTSITVKSTTKTAARLVNGALLLISIVSSGCSTPTVGATTLSADHASTQPVPLFQSRPQYPFEMRKLGVNGQTLVEFVVDADGFTRDIQIIRSTNSAFNAVSLACVSKWRFKPGTVDGSPVYVRMEVPLIFDVNVK
jgi:TonB family protein